MGILYYNNYLTLANNGYYLDVFNQTHKASWMHPQQKLCGTNTKFNLYFTLAGVHYMLNLPVYEYLADMLENILFVHVFSCHRGGSGPLAVQLVRFGLCHLLQLFYKLL